jgi:dolichol-phosphate mannosyltransferase
MANEEETFPEFIASVTKILETYGGTVYIVIDQASVDKTLALARILTASDPRFKLVWAPENRHIVDAYISGYKAALLGQHDYIIEMDAGMSHDPSAIPMFLRVLNEGNECAFGCRFMNGGSIYESTLFRAILSKGGTFASNLILGMRFKDGTSGYQGFSRHVVKKFVSVNLLSNGHFYQTELRYLLRHSRYIEVPIHYRAPSPRVSLKSILNSLWVLMILCARRLQNKSIEIIK